MKNIIKVKLQPFEATNIRTSWDEEEEKWWFCIVDVVATLTESVDATAYWRKLKQRLKAEGNETVTNCHGLKMHAADGKLRMTDVACRSRRCGKAWWECRQRSQIKAGSGNGKKSGDFSKFKTVETTPKAGRQ